MSQLLAQIAVIESHLELVRVQMQELRKTLAPPPVVTPALPARCAGFAAEHCALQDGDARMSRASFGAPHAWRCAGCGHTEGATP